MAKFSPIRTGDERLDRVQDAVARAVNPLLGNTAVVLPAYSSAPPASAGYTLHVIAVVAAGAATSIKACVPNSAGGYEWVELAHST